MLPSHTDDQLLVPEVQRVAAAFHEAGHAVMTIACGGLIAPLGVAIDDRQYCASKLPRRECASVLNCLAGWRAEHMWHGRGDEIPDREVFEQMLYELRCAIEDGELVVCFPDEDEGDDIAALRVMLDHAPNATDDELIQRYAMWSEACYQILRDSAVWQAVTAIARGLVENGRLSSADVASLIGSENLATVAEAGQRVLAANEAKA